MGQKAIFSRCAWRTALHGSQGLQQSPDQCDSCRRRESAGLWGRSRNSGTWSGTTRKTVLPCMPRSALLRISQ